MIRPILCGIETEYGIQVEGGSADSQIDDAIDFVRAYPGPCFVGWNYRYESPRADLRGFTLDRLAYDPEDAKFDRSRTAKLGDREVRSDRILPNGARFYNDHGHPEYSTPECWSGAALAASDLAGERLLLSVKRAYEARYEREVRLYKNNTDFHGASYGTHESFLVPRGLAVETLIAAVIPMLVARQILTGAGKVGSESGPACAYQLSQRADFFVEPVNAETLFRRPIFNTRDEPHADPAAWVRLHVISGDANRMPGCTSRKIGLVKLALHLAELGVAPVWKFENPVASFQSISRDERYEFRVGLQGGSWTTAPEILESYFAAAEARLDLDDELCSLIGECRSLIGLLREDFAVFARSVDWAAKRRVVEQYMDAEGTDWRDPSLRAVDLEYSNIDPEEGLYDALVAMGEVEPGPGAELVERASRESLEPTRARARGAAVSLFGKELETASWRSLVFRGDESTREVELDPLGRYEQDFASAADVGTFIQMTQETR